MLHYVENVKGRIILSTFFKANQLILSVSADINCFKLVQIFLNYVFYHGGIIFCGAETSIHCGICVDGHVNAYKPSTALHTSFHRLIPW